MSTISGPFFQDPGFDSAVVVCQLLPFLPAEETALFLKTVIADPDLSEQGQSNNFRYIYKNGTDLLINESSPDEALQIAADSRNLLMLKKLLASNKSFSYDAKCNAFRTSVINGDFEAVQIFLESPQKDQIGFHSGICFANPLLFSHALDQFNLSERLIKSIAKYLGVVNPDSAEQNTEIFEILLGSSKAKELLLEVFMEEPDHFASRAFNSERVFQLVDEQIEKIAPLFKDLELSRLQDLFKYASKYKCFNIIRQLLPFADERAWVEPLNNFKISSELLQSCLDQSAEAYQELSSEIGPIIKRRESLCGRVDRLVKGHIWPMSAHFFNIAIREKNPGEFFSDLRWRYHL